MEGIEKAERNVLPVLNNLLENRYVRLGYRLSRIESSARQTSVYDKLCTVDIVVLWLCWEVFL